MTVGCADSVTIGPARADEAEALLAVQRLAYRVEAERYADPRLPPLIETAEALRAAIATATVLAARLDGEVVGAVRGRERDGTCHVGRLVVHPRLQRGGVGGRLLDAIEAAFPAVSRYALFTGHLSVDNLRLYTRRGYREVRRERVDDRVILVHMEKQGPAA